MKASARCSNEDYITEEDERRDDQSCNGYIKRLHR